ncbi:disabled homolog 2-interacting protein-like isoform X2 [Xenia sp. Carnegie-2017]|uniref:disabled homolog 2-interacting protein-like isoform X2 n=1 Tax=Xenia sp. Carnegie-2017 TaxID=2897299 RepID=UPI001F039952|nr:disabled homolog 2-interacting protein-like isoform X2 [Xenia sp. Carnegie-2017]
MNEVPTEDWLDVLIVDLKEDGGTRQYSEGDWKEYFCVLERHPPALRIFLDEQEYDDYQNYPSQLRSPQGRRQSFGDIIGQGSQSIRKWSSVGDLLSTVDRPSISGSLFRRRLSSGLGNLLALGRLEKVIEERTAKAPKRWKINKRNEKAKPGQSGRRNTAFSLQQRESSDITDSVDLAVDEQVEVRAIHPSVIGQQYCFVISNSLETKYFACQSSEEMSKWIGSVKTALDPSRDLDCRIDVSIALWIVEAKGLTNKKRYFCELLLDNVTYAKSSGKQQKNDALFWGEQFIFEDLKEVTVLQIQIHKDQEKKKKKDKSSLIGTIDIPTNSLALNQEVENWYPISPSPTSHNEGAMLKMRVKFHKNLILPLGLYNELLEFLKNNYSSLCLFLEPVLSAKSKDEMARILVRILQSCGKAKEFLIDLVITEMQRSGEENIMFRGNSFATKAMDYYMKMVGEEYLERTLGEFVKSVYMFEEDCEVDPSKVATGQLEANQENMKAFVEKAWNRIVSSVVEFPGELLDVFSEVRSTFPTADSKPLCFKLISGTVFLRFLVPAILSPSLFGLAQEYPDEQTSRTLTLVAKVIQNLANGLRFDQSKEGYLEFMNDFIDEEKRSMREFLQNISTKNEIIEPDYNGCVDLGKELSAMQSSLNEQIGKLSKEAISQLSPLKFVLDTLNDACQNPNVSFNPNPSILSKHALSNNLYKKLSTKTSNEANSKKPTVLRIRPDTTENEDYTRHIMIRETKKRNQRYYDMRSVGGKSRETSDYSSESHRSRHRQDFNANKTNTQHSARRKTNLRSNTDKDETDMRSRSKTNRRLRSPPPYSKREFPTSDLGEECLSSGEGNSTAVPSLQRRYADHSSSAKSTGSSGGSKWTGSDYGSLPRNLSRSDQEIEQNYVETHAYEPNVQEARKTPVSDVEERLFSRPHDFANIHHSRSLENIVHMPEDQVKTRAQLRQRPRSFVARERVEMYDGENAGNGRNWVPVRPTILRRTGGLQTRSISSSSSGGSFGVKTNSHEMIDRDSHAYQNYKNDVLTNHDGNLATKYDDHVYNNHLHMYSTDLSDARQELEETKSLLYQKQKELNEERVNMRRREVEIEEKLRREQESKNKELSNAYQRLSFLEQQLREQRKEMNDTLKAKDVIIQAQERRIISLNTDYNKLLEALNHLQKKPSVKNMNMRITENL